jgi:endonuclease/exonuclease/phosphatase family metal-dependent hydrolase
MMLSIGTYNIRYGVGRDDRFDIDRITEVIGDLDIVGLQEVDIGWDRSGNQDLLGLIRSRMPTHYAAWGPNIDVLKWANGTVSAPQAPRRQFGNLILSRYPIHTVRNHLLPRYGTVAAMDMQHGAVEATIESPDGRFVVYCTHLSHLSDQHRLLQAQHLHAIIARTADEGPPLSGHHPRDPSWSSEAPLPEIARDVILLGDFNCEPDSAPYAVFAGEMSPRNGRLSRRGGFVDAWEVAPDRQGLQGSDGSQDGSTRFKTPHPTRGEGRRVDYCFLSTHLRAFVRQALTLPHAQGSDHLPLLVHYARQ